MFRISMGRPILLQAVQGATSSETARHMSARTVSGHAGDKKVSPVKVLACITADRASWLGHEYSCGERLVLANTSATTAEAAL